MSADQAAPGASAATADGLADAAAVVTPNPWRQLRTLTDARIALGRAGVSQPTAAQLAFAQAHAQARDAVHLRVEVAQLLPALVALRCGVLQLHSAAADRASYLQRPDLGRQLDAASAQRLAEHQAAQDLGAASVDGCSVDLALVVADGLSALAVQRQALPLLQALLPLLHADGLRVAPICLVQQGRVALGDDVGQRLGARLVLVLLGERPGLSSPDSLGAYLTWMPRVGRSDAERNCVSNIRPAGLSPAAAAPRLHRLITQALQRRLSGVALKDEAALDGQPPPPADHLLG